MTIYLINIRNCQNRKLHPDANLIRKCICICCRNDEGSENILSVCLSPSGKLCAVADDRKQLSLWKTGSPWTLISTRSVNLIDSLFPWQPKCLHNCISVTLVVIILVNSMLNMFRIRYRGLPWIYCSKLFKESRCALLYDDVH